MSDLRLPGLFTGIDTNTLINQLMAVESRRLAQYQSRQATWNQRKDAISALKTQLQSLKNSAQGIADSGDLRAYTCTSSDGDLVTVDASNSAFEGNHTVVVNQLANSERWVHTAGMEYAEDLVGAGTFIYSYNHQETVITTTGETTLEDLVGLINNDANNPGVTANLLYYNHAYHLMLNGKDAGTDYQISINTGSTEVWQTASAFTDGNNNAKLDDKITAIDQFSGALVGGEHITISGKLHDGTEVSEDFAITENTKLTHLIDAINDTFDGTATATLVNGQIRLTDHTCGDSEMRLDLAYDPGTGASSLNIPATAEHTQGVSGLADLDGFAPEDFTETQSAQDAEIKVDGYPTEEGQWITRSTNTIDDVIPGVTLHLQDTGSVKVTLTRNIAMVKANLNAMVAAYNTAVASIKTQTGYDQDKKVAGVLMGDSSVSTAASNLLMPFIQGTRGFITNIDTFYMPAQIGLGLDSNGSLKLDSSTLDDAIAEDYQGVLELIGANKIGSSDSNTIEFYGASEGHTTAGKYDVQVTVAGGVITSAKIKQSDETDYRDATIDDNTVTGNSSFDKNGNPVHPENGLQLSVNLSQDGVFTATVRVKQGFAGALVDVLDNALDSSTGILQADQDQMDEQIDNLQDKIDMEQQRLDTKQAQLVAKYARLEKTLALLQNQMAALGMSLSSSS
jgi:flagellar hook-associated protein 2